MSKGFKIKKEYQKDKLKKESIMFIYYWITNNNNINANNVFYKSAKDHSEIFKQAKKLFNLRYEILKKLNEANFVENTRIKLKPKFKESIAERTKLRKQRFDKITEREKTIKYDDLFKICFDYSKPLTIQVIYRML